MWGIKQPNNEWFTGLHFEYNKNQDKTRTEIKRLITASTFVEDSDYDTEGYFTIPTSVRYKQYVDKTERGGYATGVRMKSKSKQIEITNEKMIFNENDRFKTMDMLDDEKGYKVVNVDYGRNSHKSMATLLLPGLYNEYNSNTILTLK